MALTHKSLGSLSYPKGRPIPFTQYGELIATGCCLPEKRVSNQDIIDKFNLIASDRAVQFSLGITERREIDEDILISEYLYRAAKDCLGRANIPAEKISRIIYARLKGERSIPSNASLVLRRLAIPQGIPTMDISAACSGFIHALEAGLSFIQGGDEYVLILTGDQAGMNAANFQNVDTRTVFLNGDGFSAALLGRCDQQKFLAHYLYTDSSIQHFASLPIGSKTLDTKHQITEKNFLLTMPDGPKIQESILFSCELITQQLLEQTGLTLNDIDFFITSDQTSLVWKEQLKLLGIPEEKSTSCFHKYGNTVAAMACLNLHEAIITGKLHRGMTVLLMAHGAGASGGGFIFTY
ncbi:MAG: 3-oxoacyl-[acyl-carrier-protein] synthase III C-terminal domain-containing protein [Spirochaetales bacterium]|nr:3-oxoacyl-[acyl-carrier-protein] synthase III C-terminal domain-containing protein [Spirochaetales bacterium]